MSECAKRQVGAVETRDDARNSGRRSDEVQRRFLALVRPSASAVTALLTRIRRRHEALGPIDLSEATLRDLRDDGRP